MRIADNAYMLKIGQEEGGAYYPVLVSDGANLALIDAGYKEHNEAFVKAIEAEGFKARDITHIILTHQDGDHVDGVKAMKKLAPGAVVVAHEEEAPYIDGSKLNIKLQDWIDKQGTLTDEDKADIDERKAESAARAVPVDIKVKDGNVIFGDMEAVHVPGHTPGHICLYLRNSGIMVGGDALNIDGGKLVGPNPVYTYDQAQGAASLEKIKGYNPKMAVAYHGGLITLR
ncbi:MAG: MBL fold metallo-hydrolase [Clostridiales bacterium]|jgi:glyoxylase-like metal-dependent hydrolase (beta-lactamase superfamily II)|nr:MBL fold metallo-hydrolase [Clostridiales bacterium]